MVNTEKRDLKVHNREIEYYLRDFLNFSKTVTLLVTVAHLINVTLLKSRCDTFSK